MHQHKIVAHISLILSILNLVLAAPILVRGIHSAYGDEMVVAANVAAMPKKWRELEEASDRQTSPLTPPDAVADAPGPDRQTSLPTSPNAVADAPDRETSPPTSPDAVADVPDRQTSLQSSPDAIVEASDRQTSPQLSPDADATASPQHSTSSSWNGGLDYPSPPLSPTKSAPAEDYLWLLDRPQPSSPNNLSPQESLHEPGGSEIAPSLPHPEILPGPDYSGFETVSWVPENVPVVSSGISTKFKIIAGLITAGGIIGAYAGSQVKHHKHREIQDS